MAHYPICQFVTAQDLPVSTETVWDFHADTKNLKHVMPPGQKVVSLEGAQYPPEQGQEMVLHLKVNKLPQSWRIKWAEVQRSSRLTDEMISGPFKVFRHARRYEEIEIGQSAGCRVTEEISYALPIPWLSWPVSQTLVRAYLWWMFRYRHRQTGRYFSARTSEK